MGKEWMTKHAYERRRADEACHQTNGAGHIVKIHSRSVNICNDWGYIGQFDIIKLVV